MSNDALPANHDEAQQVQSSSSHAEVVPLVYSEFAEHISGMNTFTDRVAEFVSIALQQKVSGKWLTAR
jgi:hypothetical protein